MGSNSSKYLRELPTLAVRTYDGRVRENERHSYLLRERRMDLRPSALFFVFVAVAEALR